MRLIRFARLSVVLAGIFVLAALLNTALSTRREALEPPLLAGRLITSPQMGDPRFSWMPAVIGTRSGTSAAVSLTRKPTGGWNFLTTLPADEPASGAGGARSSPESATSPT